MNLPGRSAATLSALERVIVQDDDLRRPKAANRTGSPWGELAPEASEGGGMKNGGLHNFFARPFPESRSMQGH